MLRFGIGDLVLTPISDASGALIATPSPIKLDVVQDFGLDRDVDLKMLYGQKGLPVDIARGKVKYSGKVKYAQLYAVIFSSLVFGQGLTAGVNTLNVSDFQAVVPATPFQVTVVPPNTGTFTFDLGVRDANGVPMTRVASAPAAGQYSVSAAGVYTFNAAGATVYISYQYTATLTGYKNVGEVNQNMGNLPRFRLDYQSSYNAKPQRITGYNGVFGKVNMASPKIDEHDMLESDFMLFADPVSGKVLDATFAE